MGVEICPNLKCTTPTTTLPPDIPITRTEKTFLEELIETLEMAAAPAAAAALISTANMVMPMFTGSAAAGAAEAAAGAVAAAVAAGVAQPGSPGGGFSPQATAALSPIASATVSAGTSIFSGLALIGVGQLVAVFDLPRSDDNFAAIAGIFEEGNGVSQRRGKREIGEQIVPLAKKLLWIIETIERGLLKMFRYMYIKLIP